MLSEASWHKKSLLTEHNHLAAWVATPLSMLLGMYEYF